MAGLLQGVGNKYGYRECVCVEVDGETEVGIVNYNSFGMSSILELRE